ncbi:uncharacterized protein LOC107359475 [Tetranychus urticae]|uniref:uncharacterized protein LOC107359475 n=1 Tax=Tetranychus urticae TaxID=32264 RepID=UPI00077BDC07|nr:uncharacterized protein LOC107359475 [Tetranychus urticae]
MYSIFILILTVFCVQFISIKASDTTPSLVENKTTTGDDLNYDDLDIDQQSANLRSEPAAKSETRPRARQFKKLLVKIKEMLEAIIELVSSQSRDSRLNSVMKQRVKLLQRIVNPNQQPQLVNQNNVSTVNVATTTI